MLLCIYFCLLINSKYTFLFSSSVKPSFLLFLSACFDNVLILFSYLIGRYGIILTLFIPFLDISLKNKVKAKIKLGGTSDIFSS